MALGAFVIFNILTIHGLLVSHQPLQLLPIIIVFDAWLIMTIVLRNSLVKIEGSSVEKNKDDILETLNEYYSDLDFQINNENILRSFKGPYQPIWGRVITVIFDGSAMYLNIIKLGKSDSPTIIHGLFCYLKAKRIAKYYTQHYL